MRSPDALKQKLLVAAAEQGFSSCRIASAVADETAANGLNQFIAAGHHGQMQWMEARMDERSAPQTLWPAARSVIMLGVNYGDPTTDPTADPLAALQKQGSGVISVYAQRRDYHDVIKKKLKALARWLLAETASENGWASGAEVKVFVDTAPVMEKPLAMRAGLGWQGKHTNLVARDFGSWLFLGSIFTTLDLPVDAPEADHCGNCSACLEVCPTDAFPAPYRLDARRCISYLTIEHKGMIDRALRPLMGNHIYGCDDCLAVCPWNKFASAAHDAKLALQPEYDTPDLVMLSGLDDAGFRTFFAGTPIKRTGRDHFIRNVLIALGNVEAPNAAQIKAVEALLQDSADVVRATALWALARLAPTRAQTQADTMAGDASAMVRAEAAAILDAAAEAG